MPSSDILTAAAVADTLVTLIAMLVAAKLLGELAERIGQPAVLGELVGGLVVGGSLLGLVDPSEATIHLLAEIGVILLLFQIGLETDLRKLLQVGGTAAIVAVAGVAIPFALGYLVSWLFSLSPLTSLVVAAALTATSVGITARVLSDLGRLDDEESRIILGAAVIDDVLGLIILAIVAQLVAGESLSVAGVGRTTLFAFGFLIAAVVIGRLTVPRLFALLGRIGRKETLAVMALAVAFLFAILAERAGSAMIIGAFAAGVVLNETSHRHVVEEGIVRLGHFFVPIFFVSVGAAIDIRSFTQPRVLLIGVCLTVVAILGKAVAGYAPVRYRGRKAVIGVGMIPRGEVGLIFARMGLTAGVLDAGLFSALMLMVMVTTFVAPPLLRRMLAPVPGGLRTRHGAAELTTEA